VRSRWWGCEDSSTPSSETELRLAAEFLQMMARTRFPRGIGKSDHWLSKLLQHGMGSLEQRAKSPGFSTAKVNELYLLENQLEHLGFWINGDAEFCVYQLAAATEGSVP